MSGTRPRTLADGPVIILIVGLTSGEPTAYDGQWLTEYDPSQRGRDPRGNPMTAHLRTTSDRSKALRLMDWADAHNLWRQATGNPDRPLTAFNIAIEPAER